MRHSTRSARSLLLTTTTMVMAAFATPSLAAFDPLEGSTNVAPAQYLPASGANYSRPTSPGFNTTTVPVAQVQMPSAPSTGYVSNLHQGNGVMSVGAISAPPQASATARQLPAGATVSYRAPVPVLAQQVAAIAPAAAAPAATTSPVAVPVTAPAVPTANFIAPAPLMAPPPPMRAPVAAAPVIIKPAVIATPVAVVPVAAAPVSLGTVPPAAVVAAQPQPVLTNQTRSILGNIPSRLDAPKAAPASKVSMDRVLPQVKESLDDKRVAKTQEEAYEAVGLSIKVARPGLDTNFELNRAYTALMGNDTQTAIETYKNIVSVEPTNQDALFGLAATYHRLGLIEKARPFYGALLKINPNHREGLNNFLVLVSDESPQDALPELQRLEERNPDFSPIPAQIAVVLDKMGYADQAQEKMIHAIDLAPENLTYKFNLAVMLDKHGHYADAGQLYRVLIQAALRGEHVPGSIDAMQKRLNYIVTAQTQGQAGS